MARQTRRRVFTVVKVWRGMAVAATTFRTLAAAQRLMRRLHRQYDPVEEDIRLFESVV
jgi:hypothetical protein